MSILDDLRAARGSAPSALHWFLLEHPKAPSEVFALFEGHDDPAFYCGFLLKYVKSIEHLHIRKCGNKKQVYEAHQKIMPHVPAECKVLFFVDKDLADVLGEVYPNESNIYVTDFYSVENYLVSESVLFRILKEIIHITPVDTDVDFARVNEAFRDSIVAFYNAIRPVMAWIIHLRKNGQRPNLADLSLNMIFKLTDDLAVSKTYEARSLGVVAILDRVCSVTTPDDFPMMVLPSIEKNLSGIQPKVYVRGKFELWFFVKFLNRLVGLLKAMMQSEGFRITVRTEIGEANALEILGPRVELPGSLDQFLRANLAPKTP